MAYANAIFCVDPAGGSDAARTALTSVAVANNGAGAVRCTKVAHGLVTGAVGTATLNYAGSWMVTVIDANTFDLIGSTYSTSTALTFTPFGGSSKADAWKTFTSGATAARTQPGDSIRHIESPPYTSMGQNGQWTDGPLAVGTSNGTISNTAPISISKSAHGLATGDTVINTGVTGNTAANGVWTVTRTDANNYTLNGSVGNGATVSSGSYRKINNLVVTLASPVTQNIALCGNRGVKPNWTAANANVTCSILTTDYKEGGECLQIAIGAAFTTGLAAYLPVSSLDLSSYQQVSHWVKQTAGTLGSAASVSLKLCTDTAGATPVHSVDLPAIGAIGQWSPSVVDLGGAMNSAIQSVALYVNTDNGVQTFLLDNIIACKASSANDSLNLTSLISKGPGSGDGYEAWFAIQSINGTRIMLEGQVNTIPGTSPQRGYAGTTENVTLYKRETTKTAMVGNSVGVHQLNDSGTVGSYISFTGGWDRTTMTTQSGESWFDGQNGMGYMLFEATTLSYVYIDKIHSVRYQQAFSTAGNDYSIGTMNCSSLSITPLGVSGNRCLANVLSAVSCGGALGAGPGSIVQLIPRADSTTSGNGVTTGTGSRTEQILKARNNASSGVQSGTASFVGPCEVSGNGGHGYTAGQVSINGPVTSSLNSGAGFNSSGGYGALILGGSTTGNAQGGVTIPTSGRLTLRNFTINEATEVSGFTRYSEARVYSEKHDGTTGNDIIFCDAGLIQRQSAVVHGSDPVAWKLSPTSTDRNASYPLTLPVTQVPFNAGTPVTISQWFRRDNAGLTMRLVCRGGQISGVASDVVASMTASANTWELLTIVFTPSEAGVVEIEAQAYGGSTYNGYVGSLDTISQA